MKVKMMVGLLAVTTVALLMATVGCSRTSATPARNEAVEVSGVVVGGGDTITPDGPMDAPRKIVFEVKQHDGVIVSVSYTAYPPSPVGDAARAKITVDFAGGSVNDGDWMEARGAFDKATNTIVVAEQGDYIRTFATGQ